MKILYYDCFAGISGDMNLGALVDLGVPADHLKNELQKLEIEGFRLEVSSEKRKGIQGTRVRVVVDHPENERHRHLHHIEDLIRGSSLSLGVKEKALAIFRKVAVAEAKVHDVDVQEVHFHEVGALDSIADIVGAAIAQEYLQVEEIHASPVQLGSGLVECAHGTMPVPAPATAEILRDVPVRTGAVEFEATTPTGAAILAATVDRFTPSASFRIVATGYGIGTRVGKTLPNVLRVYLAESEASSVGDVETGDALMMECNIDDMNPEWYSDLFESLFAAGADDVFLQPIVMKKSRPGHTLSVLCSPEAAEGIHRVIFNQSTSIGLRQYAVQKNMLRREVLQLETRYGRIAVKRSYYGGKVVHEKPEYEQCLALARKNKVSLEEIQKEVLKKL
ncbi:MAG: nickel pincer cofactor biosynthesis protein LarC [Bacteroidales bacterium]